MLVLRSEGLLCRIDPRHGAEVVELVELDGGRQLLGRTPFATGVPVAGDLDEETWTRAYRGGWQFLTPNAGNACEVDGEEHGFHGRASNDPWDVVESGESAAELAWRGHGVAVRRGFSLSGRRLDVRTTLEADGDAAIAIAAEHISFGAELLDPAVELELPGGRAWEQSEADGPVEPPANAAAWPSARLLDGSEEQVAALDRSVERGRFLALADVPAGPVRVRNRATGLAARLDWDRAAFPCMWIWHENRATDWLWGRRTEILVVEAATVPHALGLAAAAEAGQAMRIEPGEQREFNFSIEVE